MNKIQSSGILKRLLSSNICKHWLLCRFSSRTFLSEAYFCEETWKKRMDSSTLKDIKLDQYFVDTNKKFGTKRLVSGVDLDIFASRIDDESHLDELEHLLYRFRRTKRATEIRDSTTYAAVRIFLKFKQYESLFRILNDRESYGVFPDFYSYNMLMNTFLREKMFKEAANVAILMMLQENFENKLSCLLGLQSCQSFLDNCPIELLQEKEIDEIEETKKDEDDDEEEETLLRVPFIRNPWFDDHFDIKNPQHLLGKTLYLIGREVNNSLLGQSYQLYGLALYEKWEKVTDLLKLYSESDDIALLSDVIGKVMHQIDAIPEESKTLKENLSQQFNKYFQELKSKNKIIDGSLCAALADALKDISSLEKEDIEAQKRLFVEWEKQRELALKKQNQGIDKEVRLKVIEEKKEYLFWKEKLLFFFENEEKNLDELKKA
ncbi:small ribosomal subunit protein mS27 isoform X2 [Parasteatoda tepidariorum]|uniref:small ribosomal subunit protein mS27 isoform X2 n=1 Tax=Parasteatoda tepidariorum TaxID=114398 RepID=UPI001C71C029|nr:28S ribosomal protein S27, mitochondrial-like isoform X2 [Parasteatoda tepidariorum]